MVQPQITTTISRHWWATLTPEARADYLARREAKLRIVMAAKKQVRQSALANSKPLSQSDLNGPDGPFCKNGHKRWYVENGYKRCSICRYNIRAAAKKLAREAAKAVESSQ